ncbi:unnamed protein product [Arctogadus glacialis]
MSYQLLSRPRRYVLPAAVPAPAVCPTSCCPGPGGMSYQLLSRPRRYVLPAAVPAPAVCPTSCCPGPGGMSYQLLSRPRRYVLPAAVPASQTMAGGNRSSYYGSHGGRPLGNARSVRHDGPRD